MELLNFSPDQFKIFILILIRVSTIVLLFPVFGSPMIPTTVKAAFVLVLTLSLFPAININPEIFPKNIFDIVILIVSELIIGFALGLSVRIFFAGIQLAGQLVGFQMGFMMANVVDPMSGNQVSIMEQIGYWVTLLVFLILNGHHIFLSAMVESFQIVNVGMITLKNGYLAQMISLSTGIFTIAVKIGSPAIAALLFTSVAFGICAKFIPQMNILIVGFPVKIAMGLIFFGLCLEITIIFTRRYIVEFPMLLRSFLNWMGG